MTALVWAVVIILLVLAALWVGLDIYDNHQRRWK